MSGLRPRRSPSNCIDRPRRTGRLLFSLQPPTALNAPRKMRERNATTAQPKQLLKIIFWRSTNSEASQTRIPGSSYREGKPCSHLGERFRYPRSNPSEWRDVRPAHWRVDCNDAAAQAIARPHGGSLALNKLTECGNGAAQATAKYYIFNLVMRSPGRTHGHLVNAPRNIRERNAATAQPKQLLKIIFKAAARA